MFFRRKGWLRAEFDDKLVKQLNNVKKGWDRQNSLNQQSFDPFGEVNVQAKLARAKYLFLLREAKIRNLSVKK